MPNSGGPRRPIPRTPVPGVAESDPDETPGSWESEAVPLNGIDAHHGTHGTDPENAVHAGESIAARLDRRSGEVKNVTISTLELMDSLRSETRSDLRQMSKSIDRAHQKIDGVIGVVGDLRVEVGKGSAQNQTIISILKKQEERYDREQAAAEQIDTIERVSEVEVHRTSQVARIEVEKTGRILALEDAAKAKEVRREVIKTIVVRGLAAAGAVWAVISTALIAKC